MEALNNLGVACRQADKPLSGLALQRLSSVQFASANPLTRELGEWDHAVEAYALALKAGPVHVLCRAIAASPKHLHNVNTSQRDHESVRSKSCSHVT